MVWSLRGSARLGGGSSDSRSGIPTKSLASCPPVKRYADFTSLDGAWRILPRRGRADRRPRPIPQGRRVLAMRTTPRRPPPTGMAAPSSEYLDDVDSSAVRQRDIRASDDDDVDVDN